MIISKVIFSWQSPDIMEQINKITGLDLLKECNCCDYDEFEEHPQLKQYITDEEFQALKSDKADYIAFRVDY